MIEVSVHSLERLAEMHRRGDLSDAGLSVIGVVALSLRSRARAETG
ncbi:MAG: hypothetical protein ACXVHJ_36130 [Solirubrobacteraceae bacterium]|jgi:hypothetical protein